MSWNIVHHGLMKSAKNYWIKGRRLNYSGWRIRTKEMEISWTLELVELSGTKKGISERKKISVPETDSKNESVRNLYRGIS